MYVRIYKVYKYIWYMHFDTIKCKKSLKIISAIKYQEIRHTHIIIIIMLCGGLCSTANANEMGSTSFAPTQGVLCTVCGVL